MKKILAVLLLTTTLLCGCSEGGTNASSNVSQSELKKYNTQNFSNVAFGSEFWYDEVAETLYYCDSKYENGKFTDTLVAEKDGKQTAISQENASSLYVFGDKIYFATDSEIISINKDTSGRTVLGKASAVNIIPYWDGILYRGQDDSKIHKITEDGTDTVLATERKVAQFMLYDGLIYYCGYPETMSVVYELRCFDMKTGLDYALLFDEAVQNFDVYNDKLFILTENDVLEIIDIDSGDGETVSYDAYRNFYPRSDGLYYFTKDTEDTVCLVKYDYKTGNSKTVYISDHSEFLCGPFICSSDYMYEKMYDEYIVRWQSGQQPSATPSTDNSDKNYSTASLGYHIGNFAQSESKYYYVDFHRFYSIDKKTGKREELANTDIVMYHGKDKIYVYEDEDTLLALDLKTDKLKRISVKACFGESLYTPCIFEAPGGFVVNDETGGNIYFVDADFKKKTLLNVPDCSIINFILDNEIFYLGSDHHAYKYNLDTKKVTKITRYKATAESEGLTSNILEYLGDGKVLVYGNDNLQILDLESGKMSAPYEQYMVKKFKEVDATYDKDNMYLLIWEQKDEFLVVQINRETGEKKGIYREKVAGVDTQEWQCDISFVGVDDEYLYFEDFSQFEKGNHFKLKKSTGEKEKLFSHMGEEIYSID